MRRSCPGCWFGLPITLMSTGIRLSELVDLHSLSITGEEGAYQVYVAGKDAKYRAIPAMEGVVDRDTLRRGL